MFTRPCVTKKVAACYEPLRGDLSSDSSFAASDTMITQPSAIAQRFHIPDRIRQPPARPALGRERDGSVTSLDALMILQAAAGKSEGCS